MMWFIGSLYVCKVGFLYKNLEKCRCGKTVCFSLVTFFM